MRALQRLALALAASLALAGQASAGSGRYDPATRSFSMTYMYLDLPSGLIDEAGALASARPRRPTAEQAANIQRFWRTTSDTLSRVTSGRARIGDLQETADVARADAIISLTGNVKPYAGGAWAQMRGWNVPSATLNLYYDDLVNDPAGDVTLTVVHELMHYLVGLPDEYPRGGSAALCPIGAGSGPRCLMDNFHYGWTGKLCTPADHNPRAPGANGYTPGTSPATSCQALVDEFFGRLGVSSGVEDPPTPTVVIKPDLPPKVDPKPPTPTVVPKPVPRGLLARIRARFAGRFSPFTPSGRNVVADVRETIAGAVESVKEAVEAGRKPLAGALLRAATKLAVRALLASVGVPPEFFAIASALKARVKQLSAAAPGRDPEWVRRWVIHDFTRSGIRLNYQQETYITMLAHAAAEGVDVEAQDSESSLDAAAAALAEELDPTPARPTTAEARPDPPPEVPPFVPAEGKPPIPDRPLDPDRRRRTLFLAPPVTAGALSPAGLDRAETQGAASTDTASNYNRIRAGAYRAFSRMVDPARVEVLGDPSAAVDGDERRGESATGPAGLDAAVAAGILDERRSELVAALRALPARLDAEKVDNLAILVPPGGLPDELAEALVPIRARYLGRSDIRVDLALVGATAWIPAELRDLVARTRGSVLTVSDLDEVGAVVARLAAEQTQGAWATVPEQGALSVGDGARPGPAEGTLYARLRGMRRAHPVRADGPSTVILAPFLLDPGTHYDLVVGLSQPVSVAGIADPANPAGPARGPSPSLRLIPGRAEADAEVARLEGQAGRLLAAPAPDLRLDPARSSPTLLVFDLPPGTEAGWYNPALGLAAANLADGEGKPRAYREGTVHYTFAVATRATKARLVAGLVADAPADLASTEGGTVVGPSAVLSAVLSSGASILDADVFGFVQRLDEGSGPIPTEVVSFRDDGAAPDLQRADGIYTARIPLPRRRDRRAEYRVLVEGRSARGRSRFVPAGESLTPAGSGPDAGPAPAREAPELQRATSVEFAVPSRGR